MPVQTVSGDVYTALAKFCKISRNSSSSSSSSSRR